MTVRHQRSMLQVGPGCARAWRRRPGSPRAAAFLAAAALVPTGVPVAQGASPSYEPVRRLGYARAQADNFAPPSRTVRPRSVHAVQGDVARPRAVLSAHPTTLSGPGAMLVLDMGREVGGLVTVTFAGASDDGQQLGIAFSESSLYVGRASDASSGSAQNQDGHLTAPVRRGGSWTAPRQALRGGFRYVTLFPLTGGWLEVRDLTVHFTASPDLARPNAYPNYFTSSDSTLNRIWYAGAYTVQLGIVAHDQGRAGSYPLGGGWDNSTDLGGTGSILTDGAKRDRAIWAGDYLLSAPAAAVALNETAPTRNALDLLYQHQSPSGALPYQGSPSNGAGESSDAYHLQALIATAGYVRYGGDLAWLARVWPRYLRGLDYARAKVLPNGLFLVTGTLDWARSDQGGVNLAANALMFEVLNTCATLGTLRHDNALSAGCRSDAQRLRASANDLLWDPGVGAFKDSPTGATTQTTPLYPQDGNALAVWFGLTSSPTRDRSILAVLKTRWTRLGARTPEWHNWIHPFPGGMEVLARFTAGDDRAALDLIRTEWGFMLDSPIGTRSTFWEGYHDDGNLADYYNGSYPASYTSLAHGWATAPTSALTEYLLGLSPGPDRDASYVVKPHPGGVRHAEGTLTTRDGQLAAAWSSTPNGFALTFTAPARAGHGVVAVPVLGRERVITVDGQTVWDGHRFLGAPGIAGAESAAGYVSFHGVGPGTRTFAWRATAS